ncbi:MAG TPA: chemotaxis protein CheX [Candidatus Acidoferrum sp.]|nr:chemotaxis protein CheX [Candidatus Acidoferrum sp.]
MRAMAKAGTKTLVPFDPSWKSVMECAILEVFEMMAATRLELNPSSTEEPRGEQTAMVGLAGSLCGMVTIRCSQTVAARFASLMLGGASGSNSSTVRDALGELCNMIAGNFKAKITSLADSCLLSVPTVITGDDYSMSAMDPSEGITIALIFDSEPMWVSLITHG